MNEDLEKRLRQLLRPVDPPEDFTQRVMGEVERKQQRQGPRVRRLAIISAALAASVMFVALGFHQWKQRENGIAARDQVFEALRVTNDKLDLAYRLVNTPPRNPHDHGPGA